MASLSQAKTLGGVGSILVLLGAVPTLGGLLAIVGFIMTLVAVKEISDYFVDGIIFRDMLIAVGLAIVGVVVGVVSVAGAVARFVGVGNLYNSFITRTPVTPVASGDYVGLIGGVLFGLVVLWLFFLASAIFLRRSYNEIGRKVNVGLFGTAALIYLIGAALTIIVLGFLLILVAQIMLIVAFFSIPETGTQVPHIAGTGTAP